MGLTLCGLCQRLFPHVTPRVEPLLGSVQVFGHSHLPPFSSPGDSELGLWSPLLSPSPAFVKLLWETRSPRAFLCLRSPFWHLVPRAPTRAFIHPFSHWVHRAAPHTQPAAAGTPLCLFLPLLSLTFSLSLSYSHINISIYIYIYYFPQRTCY